MPLYSSSNVIKARQSHIENKRERCRRRRRNRKREKTQRIFLRLLSSSSRDDDIIKKNNNENTFLFFLSTFFMLMLTRMTLGPPSAHMHLFNDLTRWHFCVNWTAHICLYTSMLCCVFYWFDYFEKHDIISFFFFRFPLLGSSIYFYALSQEYLHNVLVRQWKKERKNAKCHVVHSPDRRIKREKKEEEEKQKFIDNMLGKSIFP